MRREGRSRTFCRKGEQIYRTLFVSNSRNQQVATNLFQVTAYAFNTINNIRWNVYMNFTKITRYLTKLCVILSWNRSQLTFVNNLKLEVKLPWASESETSTHCKQHQQRQITMKRYFQRPTMFLKRYFQIRTTASINCTNCQKIDRDDVTCRLIQSC